MIKWIFFNLRYIQLTIGSSGKLTISWGLLYKNIYRFTQCFTYLFVTPGQRVWICCVCALGSCRRLRVKMYTSWFNRGNSKYSIQTEMLVPFRQTYYDVTIRSKEWQGRKFGQPEIKKKEESLRGFSRREQLFKRLAPLKKKPRTLHKTKI